MLDDNFKVYLIECNTNPCLETTCPLLQKIITDLVDSGLRLTLDPLFPPPNYTKRLSMQIPVTNYELCFDSELDNQELDDLFARRDCADQGLKQLMEMAKAQDEKEGREIEKQEEGNRAQL